MKRLIVLSVLGFVIQNSFGQLYIQPSIGYNFSSHPTEKSSTLIIDNQKTVYTTKIKFGEGVHLGFNLGFIFMDNFFIELSTQKSVYSKHKTSTYQPDLQSLNNFYCYGYFGEINYESSVFQVAPLIGYQVQKGSFNTYFKLGPNFLKSTFNETLKYINWEFDYGELYPLNTIAEYEYSGNFHLGLQANFGLYYSIKQNLQFVIDFVTVFNNYEITNAEIKYYEIDGVSHLYKFDDTNIKINPDANNLNHSYYGFNIGIRYVFNKEEN